MRPCFGGINHENRRKPCPSDQGDRALSAAAKGEAIPAVGLSRLRSPLAAFVLSMTMLAYEILLTRIASVLLTNQFVFLLLSLALLGISVGAIADYSLASRRRNSTEFEIGAWLSCTAVALLFALMLILRVGPGGGLTVLAVSAAIPFVASGFVLSRIFRLNPNSVGPLYGCDLAGAAGGALIVPSMLYSLGPSEAILSMASILAACGALLGISRVHRFEAPLLMLVLLGFLAFTYANRGDALLGAIAVGRDPDKDLYRVTSLAGTPGDIIDSRWSTFGRTDLVRFPDNPASMDIFIDGAAGADMIRFDGQLATLANADRLPGGLGSVISLKEGQRNSALIIGPGGGRDVLLALQAGFRKITAVDVNPQMIQIVKDHRSFNGGIYTDFNQVNVIVDEGRNFLRHTAEKYDLIMLFMPITKSSRSLNAFALSENYLFTQEAFADYHTHLNDGGNLLVMTHGMLEAVKFLNTALSALRSEGMPMDKALSHTYILGADMMPLFGMSRTPLSQDQTRRFGDLLASGPFASELSYIPGLAREATQSPVLDSRDVDSRDMSAFFTTMTTGKLPIGDLEREEGVDLEVATDDRPFFFQFDLGLPQTVSRVFWLALAMLAALILLPGYRFQRLTSPEPKRTTWLAPLFFSSIGIGFITVELALFQKLTFYLGDPSRTLALLLAALLAGSGVGSFASKKWSARAAVVAALITAGAILAALLTIPGIFWALGESRKPVQEVVAAAVLFLLGMPMGVMFPIGLRVVQGRLGNLAVSWMWAVNGSASVLGSALAIMLAMSFGYTWSLSFGAMCYLLAAPFMWWALKVPTASDYPVPTEAVRQVTDE